MEKCFSPLCTEHTLPLLGLSDDQGCLFRLVATHRDLLTRQCPHARSRQPNLLALALQSVARQSNRHCCNRQTVVERGQLLNTAIEFRPIVHPGTEHQLRMKTDPVSAQPLQIL